MHRTVKLFVWLAFLVVLELALQALGSPVSVGRIEPQDLVTRIAAIAAALIAGVIFKVSLDAAACGWKDRRRGASLLPWLAGALCLLTGWLAGTFWPNSGDEHSYTFVADTFLAGRLSNPPPPDPELFKHFRIFTIEGRMFGQYPPGWPLILAPFRAAGLGWLANPLITVLMGVSLLGAMRRLRIEPKVQASALLLVLTAPFVLFNGGSMFSHTVCGAAACAIAWQQLADEERPSGWRKVLIGALFGVLLLTRYEAFAILACVFAADRLWYRRGGAFFDAAPMLLGFLPFCAFHLTYNWAITGSPLLTPSAFTNPDVTFREAFVNPLEMAQRAVVHMVFWTALLGLYGGFALAALQIPAIAAKFKARSLRFFDAALPATMLFFLYFPYDGGHQYGPRYWFFAWPLAALTVAAGLAGPDGTFRLGARQFALSGLVAANLMVCAISMPWLIVTTRAYIDARREVYASIPPVTPAIVLVPDRVLNLWPWPRQRGFDSNLDFARNDIDFAGPVLYGLANAPDAIARACALPGRAVFVWRGPNDLAAADCTKPSNTPAVQ